MYCCKCGAPNDDNARFCSECGLRFRPDNYDAVPVQPVQPGQPIQPSPAVVPILPTHSTKNNVMCLVGFWTSIMSIMTGGTFSGITLILSIIGLVTAKKKNENGQGLAKAGIIISSIMTVVFFGAIVYGVWAANQ